MDTRLSLTAAISKTFPRWTPTLLSQSLTAIAGMGGSFDELESLALTAATTTTTTSSSSSISSSSSSFTGGTNKNSVWIFDRENVLAMLAEAATDRRFNVWELVQVNRLIDLMHMHHYKLV